MLEQNAQIILQINQAIMDGRSEVFGELMPVLNKNILYLNGLTEQQPAAAQPPAVNSMPPPSEPVPSHHSRISQSPHMLRPTSQGTPPQMSPPPGSYMANGQQQFPQPSPHSTYGHPAQQPRPQPVYSPLTQSTQGPGQPLSPNLSFQPTANGPSRPQGYAQGYMANSPMGASNPVTSQHQQQSPTGNVTNNPMPPPMNYPYSVPTRGANTQNYGGGYGYPTQESSDPNYAAMPPPQMQPKRSIPPGYRPAAPQGPVHEQQRPQGNYQSRMYMDNYAQQQQQVQYPGSQVSQQQSVQQMHHQSQQHQQQHVPAQHPSGMMQPPSNSYSQGGYTAPLPSGQYSMPSPTQQPGQFRSPAMPSPASPYGMPSPAGSTGSSS
ncbi:uncharacterized protein LOC129599926 [Paramacrobiotus metropolitanus]|uniref:uncharacterized protein LOC129599926 n=1 Tax=Paramacrobiotus metropolitanus TaxID=2943436 RepID=UPI00244606C8|nr:uncharacterized protein LOC129599926 [Paramacrobiotus metropolitanus]